jgi:translation elongation factor EF-1alpha
LCGGVTLRDLEVHAREARNSGKVPSKYAWILKEIIEQREHSRPDGPLTQFSSQHAEIELCEASGHGRFLRNILSESFSADFALLIVASCVEEFEQSLAYLAKTDGEVCQLAATGKVKRILVAVNKMDDDSVRYRQDRFVLVESTVRSTLESIGFAKDNISFVPISAWTGANIVEPSADLSWWNGPTLMCSLESGY